MSTNLCRAVSTFLVGKMEAFDGWMIIHQHVGQWVSLSMQLTVEVSVWCLPCYSGLGLRVIQDILLQTWIQNKVKGP